MSSRGRRPKGVKQMSPDAKAKLEAAAQEGVWGATCKVCGEKLTGTLKQLKEHVHGS